MKWIGAFALVLSGVAQPAFAEVQSDANGWLQKIVSAARKLNYSGTFTYLDQVVEDLPALHTLSSYIVSAV